MLHPKWSQGECSGNKEGLRLLHQVNDATFIDQKKEKKLFQDNDLEMKAVSGTQEMINTYWFNA